MRTLIALLLAAAALGADDEKRTLRKCKPREVGESGSKMDWTPYDKGVKWHLSIDEARKIAAEEGKLVFYYHVVGDLDKEGC